MNEMNEKLEGFATLTYLTRRANVAIDIELKKLMFFIPNQPPRGRF